MRGIVKKIANELNLHPSSVSRALHNKPGVSQENRLKILEKIQELGYDISQFTKITIPKKGYSIGFIIYRPPHHSLGVIVLNEFYSVVFNGVETTLKRYKSNLLYSILSLDEGKEDFSTPSMVEEKIIDGMLLVGYMDKNWAKKLISYNIPTIIVDNYIGPEYTTIIMDNFDGIRQGIEYLYKLGHRRILHIAGPQAHRSFKERLYAFKLFMGEFSNTLPLITFTEEPRIEGGYSAIKEYFSKNKEFPSAIFAGNDLIAIGAIKALRELGFRIPEDISVIGFDDIELAKNFDPPLTTIRVPKRRMGSLAVEILINKIQGREEIPVKIVLPVELSIRNSCKGR
ncbi:MAG: LacI family transcriptional regulator [Dictyoglomaceae bacterium]|nr:LacI family transcriptional regulator [Dictyoglomaceae bacterium]